MSFMQREEYNGRYWSIDTTHGTWFLPYPDIGEPSEWSEYAGANPAGLLIGEPDDDTQADIDAWGAICGHFGDYVDGGADSIESIELVPNGTLYRLSAPGYLDCTEWTTDPDSPEFDE